MSLKKILGAAAALPASVASLLRDNEPLPIDEDAPARIMSKQAEFPEDHREAMQALNVITHTIFPQLEWWRSTPTHDTPPEFILISKEGETLAERTHRAEISRADYERLRTAFAVGGIPARDDPRRGAPTPSMFFNSAPNVQTPGLMRPRIEGLDLAHLKAHALKIRDTLQPPAGAAPAAPAN